MRNKKTSSRNGTAWRRRRYSTHAGKAKRQEGLFTIWSKDSFGAGGEPVRGQVGNQAMRRTASGKTRYLGDEATTDSDGVFAELPGPDALEAHADRRENRHVKNG